MEKGNDNFYITKSLVVVLTFWEKSGGRKGMTGKEFFKRLVIEFRVETLLLMLFLEKILNKPYKHYQLFLISKPINEITVFFFLSSSPLNSLVRSVSTCLSVDIRQSRRYLPVLLIARPCVSGGFYGFLYLELRLWTLCILSYHFCF